MGFGGSGGSGGGSIAGSSDVALNSPADKNFLGYNGGKWTNMSLSGNAALATNGGEETVNFMNSVTSGAITIDPSTGNVFSIGLSGDATFTFTDTAYNKASSFGLYLYATHNKTLTWPDGIKWLDGEEPSLDSSSPAVDVLVFETLNGSTWHGVHVGTFS